VHALSRSFLWELEKLRREFGVDSEEVKMAAQALGRKRRGIKPYNDDHHLARMQAGVSARGVATSIGGRGAAATEIRISRKRRKLTLISEYWEKIEELTDLLFSPSSPEMKRYTELIIRAGPPSAPQLIMRDLIMCHIHRVLRSDRLSAEDRDHLERAKFHATMVRNSDLEPGASREIEGSDPCPRGASPRAAREI
jgi:hypothetical protein